MHETLEHSREDQAEGLHFTLNIIKITKRNIQQFEVNSGSFCFFLVVLSELCYSKQHSYLSLRFF